MPRMPGKVHVNMHSVQYADYLLAKNEQNKISSSMSKEVDYLYISLTCIINALYRLIQNANRPSQFIEEGSTFDSCSTRNLQKGKGRSS